MFFFQRKQIEVVAPLSGERLPLEQVPDQVFSAKIMGEGFAIHPASGEVVAPFDGEVVHLFPTKHALGLKTKEGLEILIHIGIDTVEMNGEGFEALVEPGQKVKKGSTLLRFHLDKIAESGKSPISPIIFTDLSEWELEMPESQTVEKGETVVAVLKKKK